MKSGRPTAAGHIHEALQDLSRRPKADLPGAIYHAMGALEAVARDLSGEPKATLGEVLKRNPGLLPRPLDTALSQVWGYASNEARHVEERRSIVHDLLAGARQRLDRLAATLLSEETVSEAAAVKVGGGRIRQRQRLAELLTYAGHAA